MQIKVFHHWCQVETHSFSIILNRRLRHCSPKHLWTLILYIFYFVFVMFLLCTGVNLFLIRHFLKKAHTDEAKSDYGWVCVDELALSAAAVLWDIGEKWKEMNHPVLKWSWQVTLSQIKSGWKWWKSPLLNRHMLKSNSRSYVFSSGWFRNRVNGVCVTPINTAFCYCSKLPASQIGPGHISTHTQTQDAGTADI